MNFKHKYMFLLPGLLVLLAILDFSYWLYSSVKSLKLGQLSTRA